MLGPSCLVLCFVINNGQRKHNASLSSDMPYERTYFLFQLSYVLI